MKKTLSILLAGLLLCGTALAETITMTGSVVATDTQTVSAPVGGKVAAVYVSAGDHVKAGDVLATIATTKVYAKEDGTAYVFGEAGDAVDTVISRYGAVAYIEPATPYTISASTQYAYDAEANRFVHPGEQVYLRAYENQKRTGTGRVTVVNGTSFTVEVTSGNFTTGELILVYRAEGMTASSRIGRGSLARASLIAYEGTGSIVSYAVENGQAVQKGDLLFETVEGDLIPGETASCDVIAPSDGVVTEVSVTAGTNAASDAAVASIHADSGMRVEAIVYESDLDRLTIGGRVEVAFIYVDNGEKTVMGRVEKISLLAAETSSDTEETGYTVTILLDDTSDVRYGMNVVVTTIEDAARAE